MPHFVVTPWMGNETYNLEWHYSPRHSDGTKRQPEPIAAIAIPQYVAELGLNNLIYIWKYGLAPFCFKQDALAHNSVRLCFNIAVFKLHNQRKALINATAQKDFGANRVRFESRYTDSSLE